MVLLGVKDYAIVILHFSVMAQRFSVANGKINIDFHYNK